MICGKTFLPKSEKCGCNSWLPSLLWNNSEVGSTRHTTICWGNIRLIRLICLNKPKLMIGCALQCAISLPSDFDRFFCWCNICNMHAPILSVLFYHSLRFNQYPRVSQEHFCACWSMGAMCCPRIDSGEILFVIKDTEHMLQMIIYSLTLWCMCA